jgi:hypothetical protein
MRIPTPVKTPWWFHALLVLPIVLMVFLNLVDFGLPPNYRLGLTVLVVTAAGIPLLFVGIPYLRNQTFEAHGHTFSGKIVGGRVVSARRTRSRRGYEEWEVTATVSGGDKQIKARTVVPGGTGELLFKVGHQVLVKIGAEQIAIVAQPTSADTRAIRKTAQRPR